MVIAHGGEVGRISSYSELSSCSPTRAGTITRSSFISSRAKSLAELGDEQPRLQMARQLLQLRTSSAGACRTR